MSVEVTQCPRMARFGPMPVPWPVPRWPWGSAPVHARGRGLRPQAAKHENRPPRREGRSMNDQTNPELLRFQAAEAHRDHLQAQLDRREALDRRDGTGHVSDAERVRLDR